MYRYKHLLVSLNLTALDETTLGYATMISRMAETDKVHFVHVRREPDIPKKLLEEFPGFLEPLDEFAIDEMTEEIKKYFNGNHRVEKKIEALQGNPLHWILHHTVQKEVDLIVVGRKADPQESRKLPLKLCRKAPCSVLVIPHQSKLQISRVLVPIDFSDHSADAMEIGIAFGKAAGANEIICLHVYDYPLGYYKTGKSEEEYAEIMKHNAQENYAHFIRQFDFNGIAVTSKYVLAKNTIRAICETVRQESIDLISVGSRGRSNTAAVLLGSITEKLIMNTRIPIIAVKRKGANMRLLEAILNL